MPVDYDALAKQHGATNIDYDNLASQYNGKEHIEDKPSAVSTYASHLVDTLNPIPGIIQMLPVVGHPIDTIKNAVSAQLDQFKQAYDSLTDEDIKKQMPSLVARASTAFGHTLAGMLPLVGPAAANAADSIGEGLGSGDNQKLAAGLGDATGLLLQPAVGKGIGKIAGKASDAIGSKIKDYAGKVSHANPLNPEALQFAQDNDIPTTVGDRTGSKIVQHAEKLLGHTLPGADIASAVKSAQKSGVNAAAIDLANGMTEHPADVVNNVGSKLVDKIKDLDAQADSHYSNFRDLAGQNKTPVVIGQKTGNILDASGNPIKTPITDDVSFPVNTDSLKGVFKKKWDELNKYPEAAHAFNADAGYRSLRDIMNLPDTIPAPLAEEVLGKIKSITRESDMPELRDQAQGIAAKAAQTFQPMIDGAISGASPDAVDALRSGRKAVAQKYETRGLLKDLGYDFQKEAFTGNPLERLTSGKFSSYPLLDRTLKAEPSLQQGLRDAYLSNLFSPLMENEGFGRIGGEAGKGVGPTASKWNQLNPQVKNALFDQKHSQNISAFFDLAKRLEENPNGSNTGAANLVAHAINGAGVFNAAASIVHPSALIPEVAGAAAMRGLTKILYNPDATQNLVKAMRNGFNSKIGKASLSTLRKMNQSNGWYRIPSAITAEQQSNNQAK